VRTRHQATDAGVPLPWSPTSAATVAVVTHKRLPRLQEVRPPIVRRSSACATPPAMVRPTCPQPLAEALPKRGLLGSDPGAYSRVAVQSLWSQDPPRACALQVTPVDAWLRWCGSRACSGGCARDRRSERRRQRPTWSIRPVQTSSDQAAVLPRSCHTECAVCVTAGTTMALW
jgi:hypothetical protein